MKKKRKNYPVIFFGLYRSGFLLQNSCYQSDLGWLMQMATRICWFMLLLKREGLKALIIELFHYRQEKIFRSLFKTISGIFTPIFSSINGVKKAKQSRCW